MCRRNGDTDGQYMDLRFLENNLFQQIRTIAEKNQMDVYLVGGFVRDSLLGKKSKDIDFVVVGDGPALAQQIAQELSIKDFTIYKNFGTALLKHTDFQLEIVGARKESYRGHTRKPEVENADLYTDLARRDFTINAIAVSLNGNSFGRYVDPFYGMTDLSKGIIRTPLEPKKTFYDDPLRIMRAIRFASQLLFKIDKKTLKGLIKMRDRLSIISQERITDELFRILMTDRPSIGLMLMKTTGVLEIVLPEIAMLKGVEQIESYRHKDVFDHTLKVVDNVAQVSDKLALRFAALYHDVAKPLTKAFKRDMGWSFHGHEEIGARVIKKVGRRLRISKDMIAYAQKLTRLHLRPIHLAVEGVTDSAIRRLLLKAGDDIDDLITLCRADITSGNPNRVASHLANFDIVVKRMEEVEEKDRLRQFQPPVRGDEIMQYCNLEPGPLVGKIKKAIEEAILNGDIPNEHDAALRYMKGIKDKIIS